MSETGLELGRVHHGDARKLIREVPSRSIDLILTDPPYGVGVKEIAQNLDLSTYYSLLPECYRVLKENKFFITFFSTKLLPLAFVDNPFTYHWQMILFIEDLRRNCPLGMSRYEICLIFRKGNATRVKQGSDIYTQRLRRGLIEPDEGYIEHPSPKSKRFLEKILSMFTEKGEFVLDPFAGSGSTGVACKITSRRFLGFEILTPYVELANRRIEKVKVKKSLMEVFG